jgi:hypothetical protein
MMEILQEQTQVYCRPRADPIGYSVQSHVANVAYFVTDSRGVRVKRWRWVMFMADTAGRLSTFHEGKSGWELRETAWWIGQPCSPAGAPE